MIPLRDVIPSRTTPYVTVTLIVLNGLIFAYQFLLGSGVQVFLHGGLMHAGGNMLYLWIFGDNVEDRMGHGRFVVFYLLCGVAAALAQTWMSPGSLVPMVGASGAIAGVMGAYFVLYPKSRIVTLLPLIIFFQVIEVPALVFLGIWFLMQFVSGLGSLAVTSTDGAAQMAGGVAFWAHVAGFAAGLVGVWFFRRPERQDVEWWDASH